MILMPLDERLRPPHECKCMARVPLDLMEEGRDWWIGKLEKPVPGWPKETHCLHMKTPLKEVWFLMWQGDFQWLTVLFTVCFGVVNTRWLERVARAAEAYGRAHQEERDNEPDVPRAPADPPPEVIAAPPLTPEQQIAAKLEEIRKFYRSGARLNLLVWYPESPDTIDDVFLGDDDPWDAVDGMKRLFRDTCEHSYNLDTEICVKCGHDALS